jgi:hypothetical protein
VYFPAGSISPPATNPKGSVTTASARISALAAELNANIDVTATITLAYFFIISLLFKIQVVIAEIGGAGPSMIEAWR